MMARPSAGTHCMAIVSHFQWKKGQGIKEKCQRRRWEAHWKSDSVPQSKHQHFSNPLVYSNKKKTPKTRRKKQKNEQDGKDEAPLNWMGGFSNESKVDRRRFVAWKEKRAKESPLSRRKQTNKQTIRGDAVRVCAERAARTGKYRRSDERGENGKHKIVKKEKKRCSSYFIFCFLYQQTRPMTTHTHAGPHHSSCIELPRRMRSLSRYYHLRVHNDGR
jgi:hypothetical protein